VEALHWASERLDYIVCAVFLSLAAFELLTKSSRLMLVYAPLFCIFTYVDWHVLDVGPQLGSIIWSTYFFFVFMLLSAVFPQKHVLFKLSVLACVILLILQPVLYFYNLAKLDNLHHEYFYEMWYALIALQLVGWHLGRRTYNVNDKNDSSANINRVNYYFFNSFASRMQRAEES
jgi:hypothetical protein